MMTIFFCFKCYRPLLERSFTIQSRYYASRYKAKDKKEKNIESALNYFDGAYPSLFGEKWHNIRLGLLCRQKYGAIINNASPKFSENVQKFTELCTLNLGDTYNENVKEINLRRNERQNKPVDEIHSEDKTIPEQKSLPEKKPRISMSEEELSKLENANPHARYPKEYKRVPGAGVAPVSVPSSDRLILPQDHLTDEAQADLLNDFVPSTSLMGLEELEEDSDIFLKYDVKNVTGDGPDIETVMADDFLEWPEMLHVRAFCKGDVNIFPKPEFQYNLYDHFALNASSLLPVVLLGVEAGDRVLDTCAAPGGKTLALLQTCLPGFLHSNDVTRSRVKRIYSLIDQFYPRDFKMLDDHIITSSDGRYVHGNGGEFDKVLVDVPCLNDRHSLRVEENNILSEKRKKERLIMPEIQADLLIGGIQNVRVGGSVVYSTCSLSPLQNDGVVHLALHRLWDRTNIECKVVNYGNILQPFSFSYKFAKRIGLKYGQLIIPTVTNNYGPIYCSKIIRTK